MTDQTYQGPVQGPTAPGEASPFGTTNFRFAKGAAGTDVYTGPHPAEHPGPWSSGEVPFGSTQTTRSAADIEAELYNLNAKQLTALQTQLYTAGYLNKNDISGTVDESTRTQFGALLQDTSLYNQQGMNLTWQDVLARRNQILNGKGGYGPGGGLGGGPSTRTSTSVTYTDPLAARKLAHDTFSSNLGRAPSKKERAAFEQGLQAYERAHPSLSTTTTDASGNSRTVNREGASPTDYASAYTTSTQALANEQGSQAEVGFVNVLQRMMGG